MRTVDCFDRVGWTPEEWDAAAPTVFQSWDWQTTWWAAHGRGQLVMVTDATFVWPLFLDAGVLYPVGAGNSDYLDVVGRVGEATRLAEAIGTALSATGAEGLRWYLLRDDSPTAPLVHAAAREAGLRVEEEWHMVAPAMSLDDPGAVDRRSLRRPTRWFANNGNLDVERVRGADAAAALTGLFQQHASRWAGTPAAWGLQDPDERAFLRSLVARDPDWLRLTLLRWDGDVVAQHLGMAFHGRYLWYKPAFEPALARRSPGTALLHRLLLDAVAEGCEVFDFGIGDEGFKDRYASAATRVTTWWLRP